MSPLQAQLREAMKDAMRARDKPRLESIRLALAEIRKVEVDERIECDDTRITGILDRMVKQRRDSITQFEAGGREDLVAKEQGQIEVLQEFLPQALSGEELSAIVNNAIEQAGAQSMRDMGKVMGLIKPRVTGRADMGEVSKQVRELLN
ncbi:MAG: GatB/YqeY domain-containing protein [Gammaproteobacteria bacterium]|nr:GatB/YqeY domain-containing protein [Gammaproteobacteria bacterium]MCY3688613.1 GatB/YqeY domain-containing protein [Gammaproteobacteria bacterium]MDE0507335.1 GatB/YqeY domain-containing protein [Gammaproteobacteria bacterium]MXX05865.1 GatB/YqeY domain-containing protein [Gammaproteobacteria bacterium]MYE28948.1 GatB/YqeY domain-containing protein [Gammaproteobacteria bacterium]